MDRYLEKLALPLMPIVLMLFLSLFIGKKFLEIFASSKVSIAIIAFSIISLSTDFEESLIGRINLLKIYVLIFASINYGINELKENNIINGKTEFFAVMHLFLLIFNFILILFGDESEKIEDNS